MGATLFAGSSRHLNWLLVGDVKINEEPAQIPGFAQCARYLADEFPLRTFRGRAELHRTNHGVS